MIWNAVAVHAGRIYVGGPRCSGGTGPSLATIDGDGALQPFPNADWNGWHREREGTRAFVCVNAIHLDSMGRLWVVDAGSPTFGGDPIPGGGQGYLLRRTDRIGLVHLTPAR